MIVAKKVVLKKTNLEYQETCMFILKDIDVFKKEWGVKRWIYHWEKISKSFDGFK